MAVAATAPHRIVLSLLLAVALGIGLGCEGRSSRDRATREPAARDSATIAPALDTLESSAQHEVGLPAWAMEALRAAGEGGPFRVYDGFEPFWQEGRFDGDDRPDVAVLILDRATDKRGIAFVHRADRSVHRVGAGTPFGDGGDDFAWLGLGSVRPGALISSPARRGHDVLLVEKPEAAGGVIWWNGHHYMWTRHRD